MHDGAKQVLSEEQSTIRVLKHPSLVKSWAKRHEVDLEALINTASSAGSASSIINTDAMTEGEDYVKVAERSEIYPSEQSYPVSNRFG